MPSIIVRKQHHPEGESRTTHKNEGGKAGPPTRGEVAKQHHSKDAEESSITQKKDEEKAAPPTQKEKKTPKEGRKQKRKAKQKKIKGTFTITFLGLKKNCPLTVFQGTTVAGVNVPLINVS